MHRAVISILVFAALAGCVPAAPSALATPTSVQPVPVSGASSARFGAAALVVEEDPQTRLFSIYPLDAETGQPAAAPSAAGSGPAPVDFQPVVLGGAIAYGFSTDRTQMAFLSTRTEGCSGYCLRIMDLENWEELIAPIPVDKSFSSWFMIPAYDGSGDLIPLLLNKQTDTVGEIILVDRQQGKVAARVDMPAFVYQAVNTAGGNLAVYGLQTDRSANRPLAYIALLDGKTLDLVWEKTLPEVPLSDGEPVDQSNPTEGRYYQPAAAFSADGSRLFLVAADRPLLVTVDFEKQAVEKAPIRPRLSFIERLLAATAGVVQAKAINGVIKNGVLSQDGRYLYVAGEETRVTGNEGDELQMDVIPLGLQVIDTRDGTLVRELVTDANQLALSPDGQALLLTGWKDVADGSSGAWTDVLDLSTWKVTRRLPGTARPSRLLDGSLAWLVYDQKLETSTISLYLPGESAALSQISRPAFIDWIPIP